MFQTSSREARVLQNETEEQRKNKNKNQRFRLFTKYDTCFSNGQATLRTRKRKRRTDWIPALTRSMCLTDITVAGYALKRIEKVCTLF